MAAPRLLWLILLGGCVAARAADNPAADQPPAADAQADASNKRIPISSDLAGKPTCPANSTALPSDAQLEAAGTRIGTISFERKEIFDRDDPADDNWLFRLADDLHVRTRESAIRAQLLFSNGDRYSRRILDESERNLRDNSNFLREPQIAPTCFHDGVVDLRILTHDTWTLQPGVSFGRSGGTNSTGVDFADANFLGFGKYVEFGHSQDVDRSTNFIRWSDPNVWGSRWQDMLKYSDNSDGRSWTINVARPFFALETINAGGIALSENRSVITRYSLGNRYDAYLDDWRTEDIDVGHAFLVTPRWTERWLVGWRVDRSVFEPAAGTTLLARLPTNRLLSYPYTRLQWIANDYATMQNLDLIARTEDVHFGLDAQLGIGYASPTYGADRNAVLLDTEVGYGFRFGPAHELFVSSRAASRFEAGQMRDALLTASASYFLATSERSRLLMRISGNAGHELDLDHYLELGGDNGLRGYPLRYQNGSEDMLFTIEERLYTHWFLFRLLNVGGAAFFDMGRTWGYTPVPTPDLGLLKDVGVGLRLGNWRSSFGSVIHVDLAAPLDRTGGIRGLQFLVSTQQSF